MSQRNHDYLPEPRPAYTNYNNTTNPSRAYEPSPTTTKIQPYNNGNYQMKFSDPANEGQGNFHRFVRSVRSTKKNRTCFFVGLFVFLVILGGAIAAAVILIPKSRNNKTIHYETDADGYIKWEKDPSLVRSFYGIGYTSENAQYPYCSVTENDVIEDVKVLSQLTHRIRLYGMDCGQAEFTLSAVKRLKTDTKVTLTIWVDKDEVTFKRQYDEFFRVLKKYGTDYIDAVSVGSYASQKFGIHYSCVIH
ncbi:hypothetical protein K7432_009852 [Basidiobolus ranarum]|uniref:glucan endo-1,3-beta-D-glucosidase n=1 Tax=Basidiobolus ranarum TaxID=34480 RepID=A0ABR2VWJ7_9FUNG